MAEIIRKLASIQKIDKLEPIKFVNKETGLEEVAENIQLVTIQGWQCVTLKSEFTQPEELCVYFQIDSLIPRKSWNSHVRKDKPEEPIRLRTAKMCGQLSQGLALPLYTKDSNTNPDSLLVNISPKSLLKMVEGSEYANSVLDNYPGYHLGMDVTELLGVTKWEAPIPTELVGKSRGSRPGYIPNTSLERIQNIPEILAKPIVYEVTEKLDGSATSICHKDGEVRVYSQKVDLIPDETNAFWKAVYNDSIHEKIKEIDNYIVLQGELIGPNICKNIYNLKEYEFHLYNIHDIKEGRDYTPTERHEIAEKFNIKHVPFDGGEFIGTAPSYEVAEVLEMAEGKSQIADRQREGVVYKSLDGSISWKAISNKYLLKQKD